MPRYVLVPEKQSQSSVCFAHDLPSFRKTRPVSSLNTDQVRFDSFHQIKHVQVDRRSSLRTEQRARPPFLLYRHTSELTDYETISSDKRPDRLAHDMRSYKPVWPEQIPSDTAIPAPFKVSRGIDRHGVRVEAIRTILRSDWIWRWGGNTRRFLICER